MVEWIKKMRQRERDYSALKEKVILPFVTTWVNLEVILLSEISQTEKDKYRMVPLICGISKSKAKLIGTESRKVVARGAAWGK